MINRKLAALLGFFLFCFPTSSHAAIGGLDDVPAATLLLPYFEVDLDDPLGLTTLFSVSNARETATVAHLTLWTDLGVPTLDFNIYLTGYDIQTFNLRDLFVAGTVPPTASAGQDPGDTISPQGLFSLDTDFDNCDAQLPFPNLEVILLAHLRAAHTGKASTVFDGLCSGATHGDNVARGYLTIDQMKGCVLLYPTDTGYFNPSLLGFDNTLLGDYFYVNGGEDFAQGETMVHLEADPSLDADHYTFYRAFSGGADKREGMGNVFLARYADGGAFDGGTDLIAWRDSKIEMEPFSCALPLPVPFPLGQDQLVVFDEEENADVPTCPLLCPPDLEPRPFPYQSNRVEVGSPALPTSFIFGAWYLNLNHSVEGGLVPFDTLAQGFVTVVMKANNRFSVGFDAYQLSNVTVPAGATTEPIPTCDGAPDPPGC